MDIYQDLRNKLTSERSQERRKAAKQIGKERLTLLGDDLFSAYLHEKKDSRTWETKYEMILSLGLIDYKPALAEIEKIVSINKGHDMITYAAAQTFVRLKRSDLNDAKPIIHLMGFGGLSLVDGALNPLAYDQMLPSNEEIKKLIELSWDLHKHPQRIGKERAYTDPRYGIAAACAGWNGELVKAFLNHCAETAGNDSALKQVLQHSIKGKRPKLR
jgi:hypothetical protein